MFILPLLLMLVASPARPAAGVPDNAQLTAIYDADQADRTVQPGGRIDPTKLVLADDARRARVHAMLAAGQVRTANDYWHAAFVYQHGDARDDYLLAHTLAVTAIAKGKADAGWIAAATLDRYLGAVGQAQVYGTQYHLRSGKPASQEPYDRELLSDDQRRAVGVPSLAAQAAKADALDRQHAGPATAR